MSLEEQMSDAVRELEDAASAHAEAARRAAVARGDETTCLNRLNNAQRQIDDIIGKLKKQAPRDTDWRRSPDIAPRE